VDYKLEKQRKTDVTLKEVQRLRVEAQLLSYS